MAAPTVLRLRLGQLAAALVTLTVAVTAAAAASAPTVALPCGATYTGYWDTVRTDMVSPVHHLRLDIEGG